MPLKTQATTTFIYYVVTSSRSTAASLSGFKLKRTVNEANLFVFIVKFLILSNTGIKP